jgi:hypothetical protein
MLEPQAGKKAVEGLFGIDSGAVISGPGFGESVLDV